MEGERPPGGGGMRGSFPMENTALLDEILHAQRRPDQQRILLQRKQQIGEELGDIIAGEIVPRLMLMHRTQGRRSGGPVPPRAPDMASQIADFAELVVRHDSDVVMAYVKSLLQRGLDLETLLLHLLAPAARRLGTLWEDDEITFVEVTIGTARLQQLLHTFTPSMRGPEDDGGRRALMLPAAGEQHTFGLVMVTELFRRDGWQVETGTEMTPHELYERIADQSFSLIGFSLSCDRLINSLCSTIQIVRRLSKNPSVLVMVGGRIFAQDPSLRPWVGADLVAADAHEALELAEGALRKTVARRGPHHL